MTYYGLLHGAHYFTIHYFTSGKYEVLGTKYRKGAACGEGAVCESKGALFHYFTTSLLESTKY